MRARTSVIFRLVLGLALLAAGVAVAIAVGTRIVAAAVRADALGLDGTPELPSVLLASGGGVLGLVGFLIAATNYVRWRIASREAAAAASS
ncbi:hypothetical protein MHY30_06475 [Microbacterium sp. ACRRU]|uniref:hypothetical protein n=1 Tax=Microbacterium sp. ACRRU TaxID=2918204 RepID=UPI001EF43512|nr:hypothetical protein [Microbacterium sp. ACRRU]MCG7417149.1 hypothetical protein [Microbacterium sp. ACRRU]